MSETLLRVALTAALAGFCAFPGAAFSAASGSASASFLSQGDVPQVCAIASPTLLGDTPPINVAGLNGTALTITQLTDPETLSTKAAAFAVGFEAVCNYPHQIVIESQNNGLWRDVQTVAPAGFADAVSYSATLSWGDVNANFDADASVRRLNDLTVAVSNATQGQIALRVRILPGATNTQSFAPLLAGIYRDTIRLTVAPR